LLIDLSLFVSGGGDGDFFLYLRKKQKQLFESLIAEKIRQISSAF